MMSDLGLGWLALTSVVAAAAAVAAAVVVVERSSGMARACRTKRECCLYPCGR